MTPQEREVMQMALDALEYGLPVIEDFGAKEQLQIQHKAIAALYEALRAALAQPPCKTGSQCVGGKCERCAVQEREWVGLTPEDKRIAGIPLHTNQMSISDAFDVIERILKEKNHDMP